MIFEQRLRRDLERAAFLLMLIGVSMGLFLMGFCTGYILGDQNRTGIVSAAPVGE